MSVEVEGEDISPEEFQQDSGWRLANERLSRSPRRAASTPSTDAAAATKKAAAYARKIRASAIKAARMPALPRDAIKIVLRPRGGLNVAKTGLVEVTATVRAAAGVTKDSGNGDILCINAQQNIVVISTAVEERATQYGRISEVKIKGQKHEVCAYRTAPHDTVKGVIRGIPLSETP